MINPTRFFFWAKTYLPPETKIEISSSELPKLELSTESMRRRTSESITTLNLVMSMLFLPMASSRRYLCLSDFFHVCLSRKSLFRPLHNSRSLSLRRPYTFHNVLPRYSVSPYMVSRWPDHLTLVLYFVFTHLCYEWHGRPATKDLSGEFWNWNLQIGGW